MNAKSFVAAISNRKALPGWNKNLFFLLLHCWHFCQCFEGNLPLYVLSVVWMRRSYNRALMVVGLRIIRKYRICVSFSADASGDGKCSGVIDIHKTQWYRRIYLKTIRRKIRVAEIFVQTWSDKSAVETCKCRNKRRRCKSVKIVI